jgi:hypothetical protein
MTGRIAAIVLAGGRSSRFGSDKLTVPIDGKPMLEVVIDSLRPIVADILVVGAVGSKPALPPDVQLAVDRVEFEGPLSGLLSGLAVLARGSCPRGRCWAAPVTDGGSSRTRSGGRGAAAGRGRAAASRPARRTGYRRHPARDMAPRRPGRRHASRRRHTGGPPLGPAAERTVPRPAMTVQGWGAHPTGSALWDADPLTFFS